MKTRQFLIGLSFCVVCVSVLLTSLRGELADQSSSMKQVSTEIGRWFLHQTQHYDAASDLEIAVAWNDPIFLELPDGSFRQVGVVCNIDGTDRRDPVLTKNFQIYVYDEVQAHFLNGFQLEYHTTPMSLDWVIKTMIPESRQQEIAQLIQDEWRLQRQELVAAMQPVIEDGLRTAMKAVEAELPDIIRKHRPAFRQLGDRYENDVLKAEVLPLVKTEILPIVEAEAKPLVKDIGQALWRRVSVWSFTWRYLYDKTPLSDKRAFRTEFDRFINKEAVPELKSRSQQMIDVTETIVKRSLKNPQVRALIKDTFQDIATDSELHQLIWSFVRDAVVNNATLKEELKRFAKDRETRDALNLAGDRIEPVVRNIGDTIFGTREKGITPEFARILRSQILKKDRRWFVLRDDAAFAQNEGVVFVDPTDHPMIFPLEFDGQTQSPLTPEDKP